MNKGRNKNWPLFWIKLGVFYNNLKFFVSLCAIFLGLVLSGQLFHFRPLSQSLKSGETFSPSLPFSCRLRKNVFKESSKQCAHWSNHTVQWNFSPNPLARTYVLLHNLCDDGLGHTSWPCHHIHSKTVIWSPWFNSPFTVQRVQRLKDKERQRKQWYFQIRQNNL